MLQLVQLTANNATAAVVRRVQLELVLGTPAVFAPSPATHAAACVTYCRQRYCCCTPCTVEACASAPAVFARSPAMHAAVNVTC
jgi:hypothetical protein